MEVKGKYKRSVLGTARGAKVSSNVQKNPSQRSGQSWSSRPRSNVAQALKSVYEGRVSTLPVRDKPERNLET